MVAGLPVGHGDAVAGEQLLALILEQVHERAGTLAECAGCAVVGHNARSHGASQDHRFVTFDVYGTLIDWETGVYDAFEKEAERDGFTIDRDALIPLFHEISAARSRAAPTSSTPRCCAAPRSRSPRRSAGRSSPRARASCPTRSQRWPPFKETNPQLRSSRKQSQTGLISNIDDKLLGQTRRHIPPDFDLVVTAQQVRSYKPDPAHFKECARRIGGKKGWVHVASSYYHDVEPCLKAKVPVIWVNRNKEQLESGQKKPTAEVKTCARRRSCSASADERAVRVVALHEDVIVATSARLADDLHARPRAATRRFVIDSPVLPDELEALPALLEQAGFPFTGLLATHGDWDHLLGRLAFPDAALGVAETTARAAARRARRSAQRELRDVRRRALRRAPAAAVAGRTCRRCRCPGSCESATRELELHPADGHTVDGMAIWVPWAGVLVPAATTSRRSRSRGSPRGSLDAYLATLERLEPLVARPTRSSPATARRSPPTARWRSCRGRGVPRSAAPDAPLPDGRRTRRAEAHPRREPRPPLSHRRLDPPH